MDCGLDRNTDHKHANAHPLTRSVAGQFIGNAQKFWLLGAREHKWSRVQKYLLHFLCEHTRQHKHREVEKKVLWL